MPRPLRDILQGRPSNPAGDIGQALATGVKKAAGRVVFGGAPSPLTDRAFVDPDRTIEELSWGFPDVALWRGISAIPPVKEALQRPEMGREVVKSLIPRTFRPFIKVGDVPPEIQKTLVDFGGIMLTGLGRGLLTPELSPQGVTSGATKRVGGILQKSPRWNKFLDDFQKLVVEKTGKSVSREEIHNSFIRTIHKEFSKMPYLRRLNRMLGEAGLVKIGKYKISEQALENLKIMLDQGTAPGAAISTVSKGEKWGVDVLKKAYKKYFKEDFPQEKPEKLPELIKGKMSEKKFKDAMLKATTEEELLNIADEADEWAANKLTKKRLRGFARRVLDRLKATPPDIGVEAPLSMEEVFKDAVGKQRKVESTEEVRARIKKEVAPKEETDLLTEARNKANADELAGMVEEASEAPKAEPRQKVKLKKRPATTAWGWVLEQGGVKPSSLEALGYNLGEWRQAGLWGLLRKDGRALDELAQEATKREGGGWLEVPDTMNPSDRLVKALQDRERTVSKAEEEAIKEYKRQEREAAKEAKAAQKKLSKEEQKQQVLEELADDLTAIHQALSQENPSTAYDSLEVMTERLGEVKDKEHRKILSEFISRQKLKVIIDSLVERGVIRDEDLPALFEEGYEETEDFIRELTRGAKFIRFKNELRESKQGLPPEVLQKLSDSKQAAFRVKMKQLQTEYGGEESGESINPFLSMRYYLQSIETQAGEKADGFYEFWEEHLIEPAERTEVQIRQYEEQLRKIPGYSNMASDDKVLGRIAAHISGKSRLEGIRPVKLTDNELKLAEGIENILKEFEWRARLAKVEDWYYKGGDPPPDAPETDLKEAKKILELEGRGALIDYLKTKDWGIIAQGYEPLSVAKPAILHKVSAYAFGKGHIKSRSMIDYEEQKRNILLRLNSYMRQILNLNEIEPAVMYFSEWLDEFSGSLHDPQAVGRFLSREIEAIKGYYTSTPFTKILKRLYSHASTALILPDPKKWTRNKFQNSAFYPHPQDLVNPNNHVLNKERMDYIKTYVLQTRPFFEHYLMSGEKPFFGLGTLVKWAKQLSLYPWTDETNRIECFWAKINALDRAYNSYVIHNDLERFMTEANFIDLEPLQQVRALNLLFRKGPEAMKRYIAKEVTYNVHFAYDWKLRSPAELSDRVLSNLFAFTRGYAERAMKEIGKINNNKLSVRERMAALRIAMKLLFGAALSGTVFMKVTGAQRNPYAPWNILQWTPGGLLLGATAEITTAAGYSVRAISGDRGALDGLIRSITGCSDMFVPFYSILVDMLESVSDLKNVDKRALRKIRQAFDRRYRVQDRSYKAKRTMLEKWQHALFGTKAAEERIKKMRSRPRSGLKEEVSKAAGKIIENAWQAITKRKKRGLEEILSGKKKRDLREILRGR